MIEKAKLTVTHECSDFAVYTRDRDVYHMSVCSAGSECRVNVEVDEDGMRQKILAMESVGMTFLIWSAGSHLVDQGEKLPGTTSASFQQQISFPLSSLYNHHHRRRAHLDDDELHYGDDNHGY